MEVEKKRKTPFLHNTTFRAFQVHVFCCHNVDSQVVVSRSSDSVSLVPVGGVEESILSLHQMTTVPIVWSLSSP